MKISEVAEKVDLTPVTLRYYEKMGLIPEVKKEHGVRNYSENDLNWISFIKCMRNVGIPVKDLLEYTELLQQGSDTGVSRFKTFIFRTQNNSIHRYRFNVARCWTRRNWY